MVMDFREEGQSGGGGDDCFPDEKVQDKRFDEEMVPLTPHTLVR